MLPHNGQGASQSIEDGYSLACCLAAYFENEGNSLEDFMKAYEDCRFPHTTAVQKSSREAADIYSQLGELDAIADDEERYRRMAKKLETWMIWMWKYDAEEEIGNTLKDLRLTVPFAGTTLDERGH
jgi:2-polyprenyl-6-methoxyphenol hydroxylase-like FAD-dependent oxidoreductase